MVRIFSALFSLCVAACVVAAPMHKRQTGDLDCNLARLRIISDLAATQKLVGQINSTDLATASAVAVAQVGLQSVGNAIQDILVAVLNGQTAPASSRDQVDQGALAANQSLSLITDPSLKAIVTAAQAKLLSASNDGASVVADCK
ncbi:hypothetical protein B0H19DRAFT_1267503 [Mycena capillaripes]|nr:hypothetical protein B0H19DRAFT_1267503 [Mycena capillaripes]